MKCKSQSKGADTMKHTSTSPTPIRSEEPKRQTAMEVIAANIQSLIEQLEGGHSEALTAYLKAMSHFHNYSFICQAQHKKLYVHSRSMLSR
jgi:hypothetical protein